jgi:D-glycero-alpha-D-manno-heptose-7-phosphate kinase
MDLVDKASVYLKNGKIDEFGSLLHESWICKRELSNLVTNEVIDDNYNKAMQNGALGGKILGAGGGGFMVFYVPILNHNKFKRAFKNKVLVPFEFENLGSQIIFKN